MQQARVAADAQRVYRDARDLGAARAGQRRRRGVGQRRAAGGGARLRDELGGTPGRTARRVHLVRVVQLHDLHGLEEACRLRREPHHEDRADAEVRRHEDADPRLPGEPAAQRAEPVVVEAARTDHAGQPRADAELQVAHDGVRRREVHDHLGAGVDEGAEVVLRPQAGDQLQVLGGLDRAARLRAHPPGRAEYAHSDRAHRRAPLPRRPGSLAGE